MPQLAGPPKFHVPGLVEQGCRLRSAETADMQGRRQCALGGGGGGGGRRLATCSHLRVASSFMTCASPRTFMPVTCEIFSREDRS